MKLLVHGGAGENDLSEKERELYREGMLASLREGLRADDAAEAVLRSIVSLENNPCFNAGVGSVLASDEKVYADASVALSTGQMGAVASITLSNNPILAAYTVLRSSDHILLAGREADRWLEEMGLPISENRYLVTEEQVHRLRSKGSKKGGSFATVGAVALDRNGLLTAGTSTGGLCGKTPGRVGDSAIIGAGTYCSEECAISFTGSGEHILQRSSAARIAIDIEGGLNPRQAIESELKALKDAGGYAGCVVLMATGESWSLRNSSVMISGEVLDERLQIPDPEDAALRLDERQ